jgi:L,D-transpeptidase-like protein
MVYRVAAALLAMVAVIAGGFLFRSQPTVSVPQASRNGALLPEVEIEEPEPAPLHAEEPGSGEPVALEDEPEHEPAPLPDMVADEDVVVPTTGWQRARRRTPRLLAGTPSAQPIDSQSPVEYAEGAAHMSLRSADFPSTYISHIDVDLTSPHHYVRLTWTGPLASRQETGPFHSSPGAGLGNNDCDDMEECNREDSNCTPKGEFTVEAFSDYMKSYPHCQYVTWFLASRGIALHSHPQVPNYPASHGCVRLDEHAAQLIHNNSLIGKTKVTVGGTWSR